MIGIPDMKLLTKFLSARHIIRCDTCGKEFLNLSFLEVKQLFESGLLHSSHPANIMAGYHWIENPEHAIRAYNVISEEEIMAFDFSSNWASALPLELDQGREAMINELKWLEARRNPDGTQKEEAL